MCCLGKSWQKRQLSDIPDTKEHIINQKSDVLKRSTKVYFLKELVHDCFQKIDLFIMCAFQANHGRKDSFFYILDKKRILFRAEKRSFKTSKKLQFFKGELVHGFCQKNELYHGCFLGKSCHKRQFSDIPDTKDRLLDQ